MNEWVILRFRSLTTTVSWRPCVCVDSVTCCRSEEPTYEALWADKKDFNEVLISPTMISDHMPDNVLDALEKVWSDLV